MPALQVRDFPEELYEQLRECAEQNHRSIAQQTIVAVEQMVASNESQSPIKNSLSSQFCQERRFFDRKSDAECAARAKKREEIFAQADEVCRAGSVPTSEEIVAVIHAEREEHETSILGASGFYEEYRTHKSTEKEKNEKDNNALKTSGRKKNKKKGSTKSSAHKKSKKKSEVSQ